MEETQEVQTFTQADVDAQVAGLKSKNAELILKEKELKQRLSDVESKLGNIDLEAYNEFMAQAQNEQEAELLKKGDIATFKQQLQDKAEKQKQQIVENYDQQLGSLKEENNKLKTLFVNAEIKEVARQAGVIESAISDALLQAQAVFELNDGNVTAKDLLGKNNLPLTAQEWIDGMKQTKPHWFPAPQGGGTPNARPSGQKAISEMSESERIALFKQNPEAFSQL